MIIVTDGSTAVVLRLAKRQSTNVDRRDSKGRSRAVRRHSRKPALWREVVWYGFAAGTVLVLVNASVSWLLGVGGIAELLGV